jgi:hypothetical protein
VDAQATLITVSSLGFRFPPPQVFEIFPPFANSTQMSPMFFICLSQSICAQSGQAAEFMVNPLAGDFAGVPYTYLGDWTDRVAKGELPKSKPPRPQGAERNIVVTSWEWSTPNKYLHDVISSDKRNPTVTANGPLYGSPEYSTDNMPILDPKTNRVTFFKMPVRDPNMPESLGPDHAAAIMPFEASAYWDKEKLWDTRANNHNSMFGKDGRLWLTASVRGVDNPAFGEGVSAGEEPAPGRGARLKDDEIRFHRYLLCHASSAVWL